MQLKMIIAFELGQQLSELLQVVPSRAHVTNCDQVYLLLRCEQKKVIILFGEAFVRSFVRSIDRWVISDRVLWPTHLGNNFHTSWRFSLGVRAINWTITASVLLFCSCRSLYSNDRSMYHLVYNLNTAINKQTSQMPNNCNLPYFCRLYADR